MAIRIGTWNLENLFKPPNPFAPKTEEEYQAKLDALASAITRMDHHVLAVEEVGDPVALGELADRVGGTWHIETAAPETGTAHTIRVGVLSRLPLTTFDPVAAFPDKLRAIQQGDKPADNTAATGRPALHVRVRIQDTDIDLIAAHFQVEAAEAVSEQSSQDKRQECSPEARPKGLSCPRQRKRLE